MTRSNVIAKIEEIAELVDELPVGVGVKMTWDAAPTDLVLLVGLQEGATLCAAEEDGDRVEVASWECDGVSVSVKAARPLRSGPPHLRLIRGGKR